MKEETQENLSIEHLGEAMTVVGIKGWAFLSGALLLLVLVILWAFLGTIPISVSGKALIFDSSSSTTQNENLEIYGLVPFLGAQWIKPGMEVECSLDILQGESAGELKGIVKEISPFPVDADDPHLEKIPSPSLRQYLLSDSSLPLILVVATPVRAKNSSEFVWTYEGKSKISLQSGMTGTMTIILDREKPIAYIIPSLGKK